MSLFSQWILLLKIIPPCEWKPRSISYDDIKCWPIKKPLYQIITGGNGIYQVANASHASIDVGRFEDLCNSEQYKTPTYADLNDLDRQYWESVSSSVPIYGAEVENTLFDEKCTSWNMSNLGSILDLTIKDYGVSISGVNTPYLYFGMYKSTFAWHTEDMDLYSMNYLHWGAPKTWFTIPPVHGRKLENLSQRLFPSSSSVCSSFLRHKTTLLSPEVLLANDIPFNRVNWILNSRNVSLVKILIKIFIFCRQRKNKMSLWWRSHMATMLVIITASMWQRPLTLHRHIGLNMEKGPNNVYGNKKNIYKIKWLSNV